MKKNSSSRRFSVTLMMLVVCSIVMFSSSLASAADWDNVYDYNEETKTATVENWLGLGEDLAVITLTSPQNVLVARGLDQLVGEFNFTTTGDFTDIFGDIYLTDLKNGNSISRGKQFKYKEYKEVIVDDYEIICEDVTDANGTRQECTEEEVGSHLETQVEWIPINNPNIEFLEGVTYEIGVFVDVEAGDYGDWVPSIMGVEIHEWAAWTETLNADLKLYYKFNGDVLDASNNSNDGLNQGTINGTPKLGNGSRSFDGNNDWINFTNSDVKITTSDMTINMWIYRAANGEAYEQYVGASTGGWNIIHYNTGANAGKIGWGKAGTNELLSNMTNQTAIGVWTMVTVTYDQTANEIDFYYNGTADTDNPYPYSTEMSGTGSEYLGANAGMLVFYEGLIDEVGFWSRDLSAAEVTQLYNNGLGISYTDVFGVDVSLNSPPDNYDSTVSEVTFNCTADSSKDGGPVINMSLYTNESGTWAARNSTTGLSVNISTQLWTRTFADSSYLWACEACNSDNNCSFSGDNRTIFVDSIFPTIVVESPAGDLGYTYIGNNETLNVTFTDAALDSCWYNYNGTNISIPGCLTGVKNSTIFILELNNFNMTIYANDTFGNLNSTFLVWEYNLTENPQTYPATSVESSTETYVADLTYNSSKFVVITASLTLNDTEYSGTNTGSGDNAIFSANAIMPAVTAETNITSYWTVSLTDATTTTNYNLTSNNVTISIINLSICDAVNNVSFWNFTVYNESNLVEINSTFDATFSISPTGSSEVNQFSYSDTTENNSQFDFCISPGTGSYVADTAIKLTKPDFVDKFYNYQSVSLSNSTRNDKLYMLANEDSTSFIVHVVYVDSSNVIGAEVQVQRYYPGTGEWLTTEILTTNYAGEAVGHLLSEDADYRFRVYQNGISILNSSATKITCAVTPCTVTLTIPITVASGIDPVANLISTLTYSDTTNTFTYTYSDTSGDFSQARLYVYRSAPSNATTIIPCNTTKTTSSGVITCDISGQINGTYVGSGYITRDGAEFLDRLIYANIGTNIYNVMGDDGVLWAFFVFIGIVMLGAARPSLGIIFGTIGLISLSVLQIINIGALSIVAVSAVAIILLMRVGRE